MLRCRAVRGLDIQCAARFARHCVCPHFTPADPLEPANPPEPGSQHELPNISHRNVGHLNPELLTYDLQFPAC